MSARRVAVVIAATVISLTALALLAGGGVLVWLHEAKRDAEGYYTSQITGLETSGYAITAEGFAVADVPDWLFDSGRLADARLTVTSRAGGGALFAGVAPETDVAAYLANVDRAVVHEADLRGNLDTVQLQLERRAGGSVPELPGTQDFWLASVEGPGTQVLEWDVTEGSWAVVVMNADGSPSVAADAIAGARFGFVLPLAIGLLTGGLLLLAAGGALIYAVGRRGSSSPAPTDTAAAEGVLTAR